MLAGVRLHSVQTESPFDCCQTLFSLDDRENLSMTDASVGGPTSKLLSNGVHRGRKEQKMVKKKSGSRRTEGIGITTTAFDNTKSDSFLIDEIELDRDALGGRAYDGPSDDETDFLPIALGTNCAAAKHGEEKANWVIIWRHRGRRLLKRVSALFGRCLPWGAGFNQFK